MNHPESRGQAKLKIDSGRRFCRWTGADAGDGSSLARSRAQGYRLSKYEDFVDSTSGAAHAFALDIRWAPVFRQDELYRFVVDGATMSPLWPLTRFRCSGLCGKVRAV